MCSEVFFILKNVVQMADIYNIERFIKDSILFNGLRRMLNEYSGT